METATVNLLTSNSKEHRILILYNYAYDVFPKFRKTEVSVQKVVHCFLMGSHAMNQLTKYSKLLRERWINLNHIFFSEPNFFSLST